jgi:hydrogenase maturation protein HypF
LTSSRHAVPPPIDAAPAQRLRIVLRGAVQGVGYRPLVYRLATSLGLAGGVRNDATGLVVEVEGPATTIERFREALRQETPAAAVVSGYLEEQVPVAGTPGFEIWPSISGGRRTTLILPDLATCTACLAEIFDPADRRYRYPFTNCTQCGPRFSIVLSIPYDRATTTMRRFVMCARCAAEYADPGDRRFHAQPTACPTCGPQLVLWDPTGTCLAERDEALRRAADTVREGAILALKGLGGFQLIVDARNDDAVRRLRRAKAREEKPFALMAPDLDWVRRSARVSAVEERLLLSTQAPIVLVERRAEGEDVAPSVAPGNPNLGVMLPYTPLHHLLLVDGAFPVVATSGNRADEPICTDEHEALERLRGLADVFLVHDRPIARPIDDSVTRVILGGEQVLRRARGYAPMPIALSTPAAPILAVGAHLKSAVALTFDAHAFVSAHIGDLETVEAAAAHQRACEDLPRLYACVPVATACDAHPGYGSTHLAARLGRPTIEVQHHHAHVAACMAENEVRERVLGVAWDGTGYGTDGTIWGGEFLLAEPASFERFAHLRTFPLPGGDAAVREPRRAALGLLHALWGDVLWQHDDLAPVRAVGQGERRIWASMLAAGVNCPATSSVGRVIDAVASLAGLRQVTRFEGQTAMELEFALAGIDTNDQYPFAIVKSSEVAPWIIDWAPLIGSFIEDVRRQVTVGFLSARFHNTLVEMIVAVAQRAGQERVLLTGGCFQNRYLTERAVSRLEAEGFRPLWHRLVPPNDGGIALGQAVVASARWQEG